MNLSSTTKISDNKIDLIIIVVVRYEGTVDPRLSELMGTWVCSDNISLAHAFMKTH